MNGPVGRTGGSVGHEVKRESTSAVLVITPRSSATATMHKSGNLFLPLLVDSSDNFISCRYYSLFHTDTCQHSSTGSQSQPHSEHPTQSPGQFPSPCVYPSLFNSTRQSTNPVSSLLRTRSSSSCVQHRFTLRNSLLFIPMCSFLSTTHIPFGMLTRSHMSVTRSDACHEGPSVCRTLCMVSSKLASSPARELPSSHPTGGSLRREKYLHDSHRVKAP